MKWNHLPVAGGIYDQHPKLLEDFMFIFARRAEYERAKQEQEKRKHEQQMRQQRTASRRRR